MNVHPNEPLSWLTLERYALGELSAAEHVVVEQRLEISAEDRACLEAIRSDRSVLPPLPVLPLRATKRSRWPAWSAGLAAAAALLLTFLRPHQEEELRAPIDGTKGGEVAILLVSEQHGSGVRTFAPGERLKVLVTCPAAFHASMRVLVFQDGQRFEPLPPAQLKCGNLVPWPAAFELDGTGAVDVCVTWSVEATAARSAKELGADAACTRLTPR